MIFLILITEVTMGVFQIFSWDKSFHHAFHNREYVFLEKDKNHKIVKTVCF